MPKDSIEQMAAQNSEKTDVYEEVRYFIAFTIGLISVAGGGVFAMNTLEPVITGLSEFELGVLLIVDIALLGGYILVLSRNQPA